MYLVLIEQIWKNNFEQMSLGVDGHVVKSYELTTVPSDRPNIKLFTGEKNSFVT